MNFFVVALPLPPESAIAMPPPPASTTTAATTAPSRGPGNARPIECSASTTASPMIAATSAARDSEAMNATAHSGITASAATRQRPVSMAAIPAQNGTTSAHHRPSWWRLSKEPKSSSLPSLKLNGCRAAIARSLAAGPMMSRMTA